MQEQSLDWLIKQLNIPNNRSVLILPESVGRNLLYHLIGAAD